MPEMNNECEDAHEGSVSKEKESLSAVVESLQ